MFTRKIIPRIFLAAAIVLLVLFITRREQVEFFLRHIAVVGEIYIENIKTQFDPPRRFAGNKMNKEDTLVLSFGEPFRDFGRSEWEDFWKIIYGVYRRDNPDDPRLPAIYRQLTEEEMQYKLINKYPQPFMYFNAAVWEEFWKMIFSKR